MALNAAMARMADAPGGMKATPMPAGGFEELALPVAVRKRMGVIAMKVFGQDQIVGAAPIEKLLAYCALAARSAWRACGMPKLEYIERNVELARAFRPHDPAEKEQLRESIAHDPQGGHGGLPPRSSRCMRTRLSKPGPGPSTDICSN